MKIRVLFILLILLQIRAYGQEIPQNFCLSTDEATLFNLINGLRVAHGQEPLLLSKSLSYVAQLHVRDLNMTQQSGSECNHHSWSDKGNWIPICYPKEQSRKKSVWDKPKELTRYPSIAYEVVYWENSTALPEMIIENWKTTRQSSELILNQEKWSKNKWKVVGVAVFKGYASAWFGEANDQEGEVRICQTDSVIGISVSPSPTVVDNHPVGIDNEVVISKKVGRFYVISGSFNTSKQAKTSLSVLKKKGFSRAKIVENDGKFRVSIDDFDSFEAAKAGRKKISNQFRDAWILNF